MGNVRSALVTAVLGILMPGAAFANHNFATSAPMGVGTRTSFTVIALEEAWFGFAPTVGRSYCVEVTKGETEFGAADSEVFIYRSNGTTLITSNNNSDSEQNLFWGSRACLVVTFNEWHYIKVWQVGGSLGATTKYDIRIVETTLFSPYFAVGGGYDAAPQIRNNTSTPVSVYFKAYNAAGTPLACPATAIVIPGNGMTTFGVSGQCATTGAFGSAAIAHTGGPGAISANITTFSGASGLSFDAAFTPRQDYR